MRPYIYIEFSKKLLSYYFIDLCQILNWSKLGPAKFINLYKLLIYRVLIYRGSTVFSNCVYLMKNHDLLSNLNSYVSFYKKQLNLWILHFQRIMLKAQK